MRINFGLAALALLLSLTLWVVVVNDQNPERVDTPDMAIPVEITMVPPGLMVMNSLEPVRFKIRAPKDRWDALRASAFRAHVDLSRLAPGMQSVPIVPESSDPQVRVLEVIPATAPVRLEEIQERTVPVKVNLVGNVPFGYVYSTPRVDPEVMVVSGPTSLVQTVEMVTVDLRLEGITVEIDAAFHPVPVDSAGGTVRGVRLTPQTVKVRLPVEQQVSYKEVGLRASLVGTVASGHWIESVSVDPPSVTVVGDPKVLAQINYLETGTLNVDGASTTVMQDLRIISPEGASPIQYQTARVRVTISTLQTSQVVRVAPRVENLDQGLRVVGGPAYIDVTIQGPAPIMQRMGMGVVVAKLDAAGLDEGVHSVRPHITTPLGVSVAAVDPELADLALARIPTPTPTPTASPTTTPGAAAPITGTPVPGTLR